MARKNKWINDIEEWIQNPDNQDQDARGKTSFVQKAMEGPITRLEAIGISNPSIKKYASRFYKEHKSLDYIEMLKGFDQLYHQAKYTEVHVLIFNLIDKYKKQHQSDLFDYIEKWIDNLDHWVSSDHLCIDAVRNFPVHEEQYRKQIKQWVYSDNFWRRRNALVIYKQHVRHVEVREEILANMQVLIDDKNYYVRKAIPWLIRELSRYDASSAEQAIREYVSKLSKTELREASKKLDRNTIDELLELYDKNK